jgi:hypothetical protein
MSRTTDRAMRELDDGIAENDALWLPSEQMEALLRDSLADPALSHELDALLPDTIEDL